MREVENELKKKMEQLIKDNEELKNQINIIQEGIVSKLIIFKYRKNIKQ